MMTLSIFDTTNGNKLIKPRQRRSSHTPSTTSNSSSSSTHRPQLSASGAISAPTTPHKKGIKRDGDDSSSNNSLHLKKSPSVKVVAKKVVKRLDDIYHHVTHTKHHDHKERRISVSFSTHSKHSSSSTTTSTSTTPDELPHDPIPIVIVPMADTTSPRLPPAIVSDLTQPVQHKKDASDPFFDDEEGDALSAEEEEGKETPSMQQSVTSSANDVDVSLASPVPFPSPLPNLNKEVPPPPEEAPPPVLEPQQEDDEEDAAPDIYLPALIVPNMFLPIPNTDPLTTLLNKYIYPPEKRPKRDLTGDWQRADFHTLVMTNSWRALARMARDRLITSDPSDLSLILGLWHLRLSCLARLRLFNQTAAECTNLFTALNAVEPIEARSYVFDRLLPFELEVMHTRLKYWAADHMGYVDALSALLARCKAKCREASRITREAREARGGRDDGKEEETLVPMWKERGARVTLILASQLVEMKETSAATSLLESLASSQPTSTPSSPLISAIGRIYLQSGDIASAQRHFTSVQADPNADEALKRMNSALLQCAMGEWEGAEEELRAVLEGVQGGGDNYVAVNNLAVVLLGQGKVKEGIEVLEMALAASPATLVVAEPFLFNLATLYELRSTIGFEKKKDLLIEVAKWSGDGLRTNCLKMPAN
ncbi:hypothetical protein CVT24_008594 [Panaeolus cyanescens]|uniref:Uncharacterized protein n=1 Tax=Panaeolus cyanescens TaxID=181874 RepID=A0A409VB96_9AGAR|nr:hypothetical protein CVT24_008594 [Panaeolus cyanescens]